MATKIRNTADVTAKLQYKGEIIVIEGNSDAVLDDATAEFVLKTLGFVKKVQDEIKKEAKKVKKEVEKEKKEEKAKAEDDK